MDRSLLSPMRAMKGALTLYWGELLIGGEAADCADSDLNLGSVGGWAVLQVLS